MLGSWWEVVLSDERVLNGRGATYPGKKPSNVRQTLIKRSAPQPAMRKTPTGGTGWGVSSFQ